MGEGAELGLGAGGFGPLLAEEVQLAVVLGDKGLGGEAEGLAGGPAGGAEVRGVVAVAAVEGIVVL